MTIIKVLKNNYIALFFSFIISCTICVGRRIHFCGRVGAGLNENYIERGNLGSLFLWIVLITAFLFCGLILLYKLFDMLNEKRILLGNYKTVRCVWLLAGLLLLLMWSPYILSFFPGSVLDDSFNSINQIFSHNYNNHHPIFYTLYIKILIKVASFFTDDINKQVFIYTVFQCLLMAFGLGYVITYLHERRLNRVILIIIILYYGITPYFPAYAIIMWKDPVFSLATMIYSICVYDYYKTKDSGTKNTKRVAIIGALSIVIISFRNNGIYIILGTIVLIWLLMRKKEKEKTVSFTIVSMIIVVVVLLTQHVTFKVLNVSKDTAVESLAVPIQQIGYVVSVDYDSLSKEEIAGVDMIISSEELRNVYAPCLFDRVKWNPQFNSDYVGNNTKDVLYLWLKLLPSHFVEYTEAYCLETVGFWHPNMWAAYGYIDIYISSNSYGVQEYDVFNRISGYDIKDELRSFMPKIGSGTLFLVITVMMGYLISKRRRLELLCVIPSMMCWGTIMLATPVAFSLRYVYVMVMLLPVIVFLPFISTDNKEKSLSEEEIIDG